MLVHQRVDGFIFLKASNWDFHDFDHVDAAFVHEKVVE